MKIGYFLSETVTNLKRNLLMTVAAISTVAISLLLLGGVQILGLVVNNVTGGLEAEGRDLRLLQRRRKLRRDRAIDPRLGRDADGEGRDLHL